jgi:GNAT superfamily N-acetyltransferase
VPLVTANDTTTLLRLVDAVVAADPVRNTVFGSIAFGLQQDDAAGWAAHPVGAELTLAARSQPHTPVAFTAGWADLGAVVDELSRLDPPPAGLGGPTGTVEAVATALGGEVTDRMDERLFRLDRLVAPSGAPGSARLAVADDVDRLSEWYAAFAVEAFGRLPPGFDAVTMVRRGIVRSRCWLWLDPSGTPRSMAVRHPAVRGAARIGPVYTPPDDRGRGYGSAATAAASQDILDEGAVACLYTDRANPTSNKIYQAIGFVAVLDRTMIRFD